MPAALCRRHTVLPIAIEDGVLVVATSNPGNVVAVDDVRAMSGMAVRTVVATHDNLLRAIDRYCRVDGEMEDLSSAFEVPDVVEEDLARAGAIADDDAPIVRFVNLLVTQAITDRASDIHIEPTEHDLRVRYRIDGVLHETQRAPKQIQGGVISRIKILARHRHRRAAQAAGRAHVGHPQRPQDRPARGDAADRVGREDRPADPRQLHARASTCASCRSPTTTSTPTAARTPSPTG